CYCSEERLADLREEQKAKGLPTGYDRHCRFLSEEERHATAEACERESRAPVVRFAVPLEGTTTVHDAIRGEWTVENSSLEDMILLKSDGLPTYHLGHLVDDHDMRITHVMRGLEYIPTAPLHVLIHRALGWESPLYVHLPLILDPGGQGKMSKRKQNPDGSVSEYMTQVGEFREAGYLPQALLNYIALLGWSVAPDRDIATIEEMIEKFDIHDIKKSPAAFDYEKLEFMNGYYIRQLPLRVLAVQITPFLEKAGLPLDEERVVEVLPLVQERMKLLSEAPELLDFFLADAPLPDPAELIGNKMDAASTIGALEGAHTVLASVDWSLEAIEEALRAKAEALGLKPGQLFQPIRLAVTGRKFSPGIFETLYHVGRERVLERLERAARLLQE
ncbi:MAG: glutamate--tRNA ligase, partial [Ardenticatenaceae bacterium]